MAKDGKREEAEKLYVKQSMTCPQIAAELGVNDGTVYRWKAEAAQRGETADWDAQRRAYNMSPRELVSIYSESLKAWVVKIRQNPEILSDPKTADAVVKHISALQKLDNPILPAIPRKWKYNGFEGLIVINAEEHSDHTGNTAKQYVSVAEVQFTVQVVLDEEMVPSFGTATAEPEIV